MDQLDEGQPDARPEGQPSALWLVEQAEAAGGWLCGSVNPALLSVRVDAIQVPPGEPTRRLLAALAEIPAAAPHPPPTRLALVESWESARSARSIWQGSVEEAASGMVPQAATVVGLSWD